MAGPKPGRTVVRWKQQQIGRVRTFNVALALDVALCANAQCV